MDRRLCFSRTEKGREELVGAQHTLKPKQRQVLFLVGEAVTLDALHQQLPHCTELAGIVQHLWEEGYIGIVKPSDGQAKGEMLRAALAVVNWSRLDTARQEALARLATLVGSQSPSYHNLRDSNNVDDFRVALQAACKVVSAVASPAQAHALEADVEAILRLPAENAARHNGIDVAKRHALEIVASLVGEKSPVYAKISHASDAAALREAVAAGRKVLAAVASSTRAQSFEAEVLKLLE